MAVIRWVQKKDGGKDRCYLEIPLYQLDYKMRHKIRVLTS